MNKIAYLTIDDGPSKITTAIADYLLSRSVPAVMYFVGNKIERNAQAAIYAIKKGFVIGNHSYTHPRFSEISVDEAINEIKKQDALIDRLYVKAHCKREYKTFRFPFGDKGGPNKEDIQMFLKSIGYMRLDCRGITYDWFSDNNFNKDIDAYWSFDYCEYKIAYDSNAWSRDDIIRHMDEEKPQRGGSLLNNKSEEIILMHDHPLTEAIFRSYYSELIDRTINMRVNFNTPAFII